MTLAPPIPHSTSSESALCAALMLDHEAAEFPLIRQTVSPSDFHNEAFKWIYEACILSLKEYGDVTVPTVAFLLEQSGRLDEVGAEVQLIDICSRWFTSIGAVAHARVISGAAKRRRRITAAGQEARRAWRGENTLRGWISTSG